jgi:radical SAM superfamily enzyme YgiQ (UPF0313 family)
MKQKTEKLKIALIQPPANCVDDDRLEPHLGLLYIAACLKKHGWENIVYADLAGNTDEQSRIQSINNIPNADVYGISCYATNYEYVRKIINRIKEFTDSSYIILGGPNPTALPDFSLNDSGADAIITGEGEDAFLDLLNSFSEGVIFKGIKKGTARMNIDSYPFPDRTLANMPSYSRKLNGLPTVSVLSSRGCASRCIHCNSVVMGGGASGTRYRSPANLIDELSALRNDFSCFRFNDDHFTGNPALEELSAGMRDLDIKFRIFARLEDLDNRTCRLLSEAGCLHVSIGIESINPQNLKILGKAGMAEKTDNIRFAKDHGMTVRASFMVGLPYDNDRSIEEFFSKAAKTGIDEFAIYPLIPYPGTLIAKFPEKFGYEIIERNFTEYVQMGRRGKTVFALKHTNFSPSDVRRWLDVAEDIMLNVGIRHMRDSDLAQ